MPDTLDIAMMGCECGAQLAPPSEEVAAAMRQVAAPSGADIANHAARVLSERLAGER